MEMSLQSFRRLVETLPYGKRVPTAVYLHRQAPAVAEGALAAVVRELVKVYGIGAEFNVLKFRTDLPRVSFLSYPAFFTEAHPSLQAALAIDLASGKSYATDYRESLNPPILHRKELFLPPDHASVSAFAALSAAEESAGLYRDTTTIGFRQNWERLLRQRRVVIDGHELRTTEAEVTSEPAAPAVVHRHRTALTRYTLSRPVKTLVEFGQLPPGTTFFDYGCGLGADVRGLRELGVVADGWDPVHMPSAERRDADVVNLGYVLNVVEHPAERMSTLHEAWQLTKRLLVVSVLIKGAPLAGRSEAYGDGLITGRQTFQKYFTQQETQQLLEDALEQVPIPVALGVFYVFRDAKEHQAFLTARTRRHVDWEAMPLGLGGPSPRISRPRMPREEVYETHRELAEAFWARCLELGRLPLPVEFSRYAEVVSAFGSPTRALAGLLRRGHAATFDSARAVRRNDLLIYLAAGNLQRKVKFSQLPDDLQEDIREFFGNYSRGLEKGLKLLHAAADPQTISLACDEAQVGWQDSDALYVHGQIADQLPPVLRAYIACGERLYGDARQADIVKVHKRSGKVSFMMYEGFDTYLLPELQLRAKVNLRTLWVEVFDHSGQGELLYYKERFLSSEHPQRQMLLSLGKMLRRHGISESAFLGSPASELWANCKAPTEQRILMKAFSPSARKGLA